MSLANRNLVTIDDLSNGEMEAVFSLADEMSGAMNDQLGLCRGKIMASLFFEPSTRTRLSFETAMHRLGGSVITAVDVGATSLAKGESIADMARVVGSYVDLIVIRHPWEGAAKVMADYAGVPVINAGDGSHEHPTQTLCDLYTIKKERQTIKGLKIALCGDLKYGRTIHSLTYALARFGVARIYFYSKPGLNMPQHVLMKLTREHGGTLYEQPSTPPGSLGEKLGGQNIDAIYITPTDSHQLALMPDVSFKIDISRGALYMTRIQKERVEDVSQQEVPKNGYLRVSPSVLKGEEFERTLIMHPLPRIDELAYEMDDDPRSMYFKQAARGVPVRMALLAFLMGTKEIPVSGENISNIKERDYPIYSRDYDIGCENLECVSNKETEAKYIKPQFKIVSFEPLILSCAYCEHEFSPPYIASSEWHQGKTETKRYHSAASHWARKIRPEHLIVFNSAGEAEAHGFKPSRFSSVRRRRKSKK